MSRLVKTWTLLIVAWLLPGGAGAETLRTVGSATVACDTQGACVAAIPMRDADGRVSNVLQVGRRAEASALWTVAVSTLAFLADRTRPVALVLDGKSLATLSPETGYAPFLRQEDFYIVETSVLSGIVGRLSKARTLRLSYIDVAGGPHDADFNLEDLAAALAEIDAVQGRVDADRRAGPPEHLPRAEEIDRQLLVARTGLPPRLAEWHALSSTCEDLASPALEGTERIIAPLSPTAMLYGLPCYMRSGRPNHRFYLVENGEIGGLHTLYFATYSRRFGWMGTDVLEDAAFDAAAATLTATDTGGPDGCGSTGRWQFEDFAFRLVETRAPRDCASPGPASGWSPVFPP